VIRGRAAAKTRARKAAARGRRSAYEAHLNSFLWRRIRELVIARDGGCCVLCAARTRLHVHHLHYKTFGDETGEELATLCEPCHEREHRRRPGKRRAQGPFAAVRTSTSAADLDAEFAARLARET
jgi:5-methylcytosine-specific restriction endonuclease McrA